MEKSVRIKDNRAQQILGMSFGTIFSILLIIAFIVVAVIVIKTFLNTGNCASIGVFKDNLQSEINRAWNSDSAKFNFSASLPSGIEYVCFGILNQTITTGNIEKKVYADFKAYTVANYNFFLYPRKKACKLGMHKLEHIDISWITSTKNPYCIATNGKAEMYIALDFDSALVKIGEKGSLVNPNTYTPGTSDTGSEDDEDSGTQTASCINDNQCVRAICCHASTCVNISQKPDCTGSACTLNCAPGTLDCGAGSCKCVNNQCQAVFN